VSDFDFSDSGAFLDFGVSDLAELSGPVAIPDTFAPQLDLASLGFVPFDLELFDPVAPDVAAQQLLDQQLATDRLALDMWEQALADEQLLAETDAPDALELWTPDPESLDRPLGSSGLATTAKRRLTGAVKEGRQRSRAAAQAASEKGRTLDPERHERATELAKDAAAKLKKLGSWSGKTREALTMAAGASEKAASAGRALRSVSGVLQGLPLVSLPADLLRAKSSIAELAERVKAEPENPYPSLWLGEALKALERDTRFYLAARAALQPTTLLVSQALKTGAMVGADSVASPAERVLGRAFELADRRVSNGRFDADALHVIARVYLARGTPEAALEPARLALADASDPGRGAFLFTLARAFLAAGRLSSARRAAELAIAAGMTLGHELLAELLFRENGASTAKERQQAYVDRLDQVDERDRIAYYGISRSGSDVLRAAFGAQRVKLGDAVERGRTGWRAARVGERSRKLVSAYRARGLAAEPEPN
jgi:hypothetical protein